MPASEFEVIIFKNVLRIQLGGNLGPAGLIIINIADGPCRVNRKDFVFDADFNGGNGLARGQ